MDFDPGTNVLVLGPSLAETHTSQCLDLLTVAAPSRLDVLRITYSEDPQELVEQWREHVGTLPARTGIVVVGTSPNGPTDADLAGESNVAVTSANSNDITGLGMLLNNYLNDVDDAHQLVVCLDSLTELLQFTDVQSTFKFLHTLTGQLREADAIGHFHMDPAAHEEQTIGRLKPAFDDAVHLE